MNYKILFPALAGLLILAGPTIYGQNIGINTSGTTPTSSAILDLNTGNTFTPVNSGKGMGFLVPNVPISSTTDNTSVAGLGAATNALLIYNTSTSGAGSTA